jgi:Flp pilus assembly pilin Flp
MKKQTSNLSQIRLAICQRLLAAQATLIDQLQDQRGQGTTEYAILVGVSVVNAIVAIVAFKGSIQNLWDQISDAITSLG